MVKLLWALLWMLALTGGFCRADPLDPSKVPEALRPWTDWVLRGSEERICPFLYNSAADRFCAWPSRLELNLAERGGEFRMHWSVQSESWAQLPGDDGVWPQDVSLDGKPARVMPRDGRPAVLLAPGRHVLAGRLPWERLPESLSVPRASGVLSLTVRGREIAAPAFNEQGQLWLEGAARQRDGRAEVSNRLGLQVFRQIIDEVPMRVVTRLDLDVAGESREVLLTGALPSGFIGLSLQSALPVRLENDHLRVQLRPGRWHIELTARHPAPLEKLSLPQALEPWPAEEVWVFQARPQLRVVEVDGVAAVDPGQTNLPEAWRNLPAYRVGAGDTVTFRLIQRGDPEPEPDALTLERNLWLDFDGDGYTVSDQITGRMTHDWRLNALGSMQLGRVAIDGAPQLITRLGEKGPVGVEVRRGALRMTGDSRLENGPWRFPATGWDKDFRSVSATLHLPPGWRLFAATGVDNAPDGWVSRWTLLDLFLVLIAALAVARLWHWPAGVLAVAALALLWHEPGAPRLVWLNLLVAAALLRVLPAGRLAAFVRFYRGAAMLGLVAISVPFMVEQIRTGIYPQLELPWFSPVDTERQGEGGAVPQEEALEAEPPAVASAPAPVPPQPMRKRMLSEYGSDYSSQRFDEVDPGAVTQTGPGLPQWRWKAVTLGWNGPVMQDQEVGLWLISPRLEMLLKFLRVVLLLALALVFTREILPGGRFRLWPGRGGDVAPGLGLMLAVAVLAAGVPGARAEFPPQALLDELKSRLLESPECLPQCAQIPSMRLRIEGDVLQQELEIHAQRDVAVPLPAQEGQWLPGRISVDGVAADGLRRSQDGVLWLHVTAGRHLVALSGALPAREQVQLPLPLKPRRVETAGAGWTVAGVGENGVPDAQLQLSRIHKSESTTAILEPLPLPAFLEVQRTLRLGLDWRVATRIRRLSPADAPVVVDVPLLQGESVLTQGLPVRGGKVSVSLLPGQSELQWESILERRAEILLKAPETSQWVEAWRVDVSPIWHLQSDGIAVAHHQDSSGNWLPEWRPWPGEAVTLTLSRPQGIAGKSLTIESSRLQVSPGKRATDSILTLSLRSSQGGQQAIRLPAGAVLQSVAIDGQSRPIRQQDGNVTLPIHPGQQSVVLNWRDEVGIAARYVTAGVDLGAASVNSFITLNLPRDRWVLLAGGPRLGPAVLFWGVVAVIVILSLGLGMVRWTPIKAWQWALLLLGLSQVPLAGGLCVVGWLLLLGWRGKSGAGLDDSRFNVLQLALAALSFASLLFLFYAVEQGLLGLPDMQVAGNNSDAYNLNWYQDHSAGTLPRPWVLTAPLWSYRVLMLVWALWLAFSLLNWLRWGWVCYGAGGLWRARPKKAPAPVGSD